MSCGFAPRLVFDDIFDICDAGCAADRHSVGLAEFKAVPFAGVMAGGNHDAAVGLEFTVGVV